MAIIWEKAWDIGHAEIDKQHRYWIEIFNRLEDSFLNGSSANMNALQQETLQQMLDYSEYHFKTEEKLMSAERYTGAAEHWRLHKNFKNVLYEKLRNLKEEGMILNSELLQLMKNWLERHILVEDRKFVVFLEAR